MLPKTKLGDAMFRKLKVYAGKDHPHAAQQPTVVRGRITWLQRSSTQPGAARNRRRACSSGPASGTITVNQREFANYFPSEALRVQVVQPLQLTETADKFDVLCTVAGGGITGQAGAIRLGIARALVRGQRRESAAPEEGRAAHARCPREGAQEVRHGWRPQTVPVQ